MAEKTTGLIIVTDDGTTVIDRIARHYLGIGKMDNESPIKIALEQAYEAGKVSALVESGEIEFASTKLPEGRTLHIY